MHLSSFYLLLPIASSSLRDYFGNEEASVASQPAKEDVNALLNYRPPSPHEAWVSYRTAQSTEAGTGIPVRPSVGTELTDVSAELSNWRDHFTGSTSEGSNGVTNPTLTIHELSGENPRPSNVEGNGWGGWFHMGAPKSTEAMNNRLDRILAEIPQPHRFVEATVGDDDPAMALKLTDFYAQCLAASGMISPQGTPEILPTCDLPKLATMCRLPGRGCHVAAGYLWSCISHHAVDVNCTTFVSSTIGAQCSDTVQRLLMCLTGLDTPTATILDGAARLCK